MEHEILETQSVLKSAIMLDFKDNTSIRSLADIPIANKAAYDSLMDKQEVFEFISTMKLGEEFPAQLDPWTTVIMTTEWAQSFAEAVKSMAKPVFIKGHADEGISAKERAIPDGYITGAKVIDNTMFLRNSLPEGTSEVKKALVKQTINEIKANMLSTSIANLMRLRIEVDEDGDRTYYAQESVKGQSNALVEADQTGSEAEIILTSFKTSDEQEEAHTMGENVKMTNEDHFTALKNQIDSGRLALKTVAEGLGIDVTTKGQKECLDRLNAAESQVGKIDVYLKSIESDKVQSFVSLKKSKIEEKFKDDDLIEIATSLFALKSGTGEEIDTEIDRLVGLKVFKNIQGNRLEATNVNPSGSGEQTAASFGAVMEA